MDTSGHAFIAVDIGNTRTKFGFFGPEELARPFPTAKAIHYEHEPDHPRLFRWLRQNAIEEKPVCWCVSSVNKTRFRALKDRIRSHRGTGVSSRDPESLSDTIQLLDRKDIPLILEVDEPDAVGMDRLLVALAACHAAETEPLLLAVDLGTAVTVDLIAPSKHVTGQAIGTIGKATAGIFHGGAIFPGIDTASRALHSMTDRLPRIDNVDPSAARFPGKNTVRAMEAGIAATIIGAVSHCLSQVKNAEQLDRLPIILAGGAAPAIREAMRRAGLEMLDYPGFPDLLLSGIALAKRVLRSG